VDGSAPIRASSPSRDSKPVALAQCGPARHPGSEQRDSDILASRQCGQEIVLLEHESEVRAANKSLGPVLKALPEWDSATADTHAISANKKITKVS